VYKQADLQGIRRDRLFDCDLRTGVFQFGPDKFPVWNMQQIRHAPDEVLLMIINAAIRKCDLPQHAHNSNPILESAFAIEHAGKGVKRGRLIDLFFGRGGNPAGLSR